MPTHTTLTSLFTDIADAIREKTGSSDMITADEFPAAIAEISGGEEYIQHAEEPEYVKKEVRLLLDRAMPHIRDESIVFLAGSDAHQSSSAAVINGNLYAGYALKSLAYTLPVDFVTYLGDYTDVYGTADKPTTTAHIKAISRNIDEAFLGVPNFRTTGNHDALSLTQAELYPLIGQYNEDSGVTMGSTTSGYCYKDFAGKNVRVICLNSCDVQSPVDGANAISAAQQTWFTNTLDSTPANYGIIILSHHPLDWYYTISAADILATYKTNNPDRWILCFHGHTHNFLVDNVYYNRTGTPPDCYYDTLPVKRIAIPNMMNGRNNEYGVNWGINYGTTDTYSKTENPGSGTSLCAVVINPSESKVYAFAYGSDSSDKQPSGIDREVYYGTSVVSVTGITLDANSGTLHPAETVRLTATVTPANASNKMVIWTSSNQGVATVSNGLVTAVGLGSATITATTQDGNFTAQYALTVSSAHTGNLVSYFGADDNKRLSTGTGDEKTQNGCVTVGYIDLSEFLTEGSSVFIRTRGVDFLNRSSGLYQNSVYCFYRHDKTFNNVAVNLTAGSTTHGSITVTRTFNNGDMTIEISGLTFLGTNPNILPYHYLRICGVGSGEDLEIYVNEPLPAQT